jgi:Trk K+ transport system NAD-binding subunit
VAGVWNRGTIEVARPGTELGPASVLVLAGSRGQLDAYDDLFAGDGSRDQKVVVIGGGRVGRAAGRALADAGIEHRIVEQRADRVRDPTRYVIGDAAELTVLQDAGIEDATAAIITTHDDDVNVYLTIYCRRLRPDLQVIARARLDRNVSTLHRAGADAVLSYASTGATAIWNVLTSDDTLQLAEGLEVFRTSVPAELAGRSLTEARIREDTGCTVVAVANGAGLESNPDARRPLPPDSDLVLIGDDESQHRFLRRYGAPRRT